MGVRGQLRARHRGPRRPARALSHLSPLISLPVSLSLSALISLSLSSVLSLISLSQVRATLHALAVDVDEQGAVRASAEPAGEGDQRARRCRVRYLDKQGREVSGSAWIRLVCQTLYYY
jgi:hypothetical protein